jgi:hypothetical protein
MGRLYSKGIRVAQVESLTFNRLVAVGDLLGFRERVLTRPTIEVVDTTIAYVRNALYFAIHRKSTSEPPPLEQLEQHSRVGIAWFSDTILLYALDDTDEARAFLLEVVAYLLFFTTIPNNARMRIGIDYGELYVDRGNRIYVGPALVHAYELQGAQAWAGGALTPSAAERAAQLLESHVVTYNVPGKGGAICSRAAIDWTFGIHTPVRFEWSRTRSEPTPEDDHGIVLKWRNTKRFHDEHCTMCPKPMQAHHGR